MADEVKAPVDLLDYLFQKWKATGASSEYDEGIDENAVLRFFDHARQTLRDNMPIAMDFMSDAPSLRFQDNTVLPIVDFPDRPPGMEGLTGFVPVGKQRSGGGLAPSQSWGVTGEPKK